MKKYIKYIAIASIIVIIVVIAVLANSRKSEDNNHDESFKMVTSFYPIYIMAENITEGASHIELINMADTNVGCIHNYTINTADMKKLENADVFIQNGLGLESFTDKIISSNKGLQVIDSSKNIPELIQEEDETNPHIWTSVSNYIVQVENIARELQEKNPENAKLYAKNAKTYIQKLNKLKSNYDTELQDLKGEGAVSLNESFEYLGKELGLNLITIHTSHEESALSAETLKNVINTVKQNHIKMIIIDMNDDPKNAQTIANETGAEIYRLDSGLTGSLEKEAYIKSMNSNLEILKNIK